MLDIRRLTEHAPSPHDPGAATPTWTEASVRRPCPVCGAPGACAVIEGDEFARCMHTQSRWPVLGGGWLHRLTLRPEEPGAELVGLLAAGPAGPGAA
jgi:hypothetical protein